MHIHIDGWYAGIAAAQWLALRLQTIAAFVISLVALLAVLGHEALLPFAVSDGKFAASKPSLPNMFYVVLLQVSPLCCISTAVGNTVFEQNQHIHTTKLIHKLLHMLQSRQKA